MSINVSNLILALQQKIDSTTNERDLLHYSKALQQLKTGLVYTVNTTSQLPVASQNTGLLYYVINDELIYFSTSTGWSPLFVSNPFLILAFGNNTCGQLGDNTRTNTCSPVQEISFSSWCSVSAGFCHTAAIKAGGQLWAWGYNGFAGSGGALGDGTITTRCSPVREFCSATDWCRVSAGCRHTGAIKTTGQLWAWGRSCCGTLGDGTTVSTCSPVREFCSATDWCQISAGRYHTAAVKTSGQIWVWGLNSSVQLGDGTATARCSPVRERCSATDWCGVSAGQLHTAAIKTSGQIWTWGLNTCGRLGDGTTVAKCSPVRERCSATDWCGVSVGTYHTAAVKTTGQIWAWGLNQCGRLGDGTTVEKCSPVREFCSATDWCGVSAGTLHTGAVKTTGQLWAWGNNVCGRLGDGTTVDKCSPVREVSSSTNWSAISSGGCHTAAIRSVGSL